jgi:hypothetical protein
MPAQGRMKDAPGPISFTSPVAFLRKSSTLTSSVNAIFPVELSDLTYLILVKILAVVTCPP